MQPVSSTRRILAAAIAAALLPAVVQADPTSDELLQKIDELSQKVLVLERKLEIQDEAATAAKATDAGREGGPERLQPRSRPTAQNQIKLRGTLHVDGRYLRERRPRGPDGHLAGDARAPDDRGHARRHLRFPLHAGLRPGPHGHPGRLRHRATSSRALQVTAGKFKAPVGLERLQSANDIRLVAARLPDQPRAEPRHRPAGRRRLRSAGASTTGRLPERLERRRQQRDVRRRRHQRRQGICGARLRARRSRKRQLRAARPRPRHRRHLHDQTGTAAQPLLPDLPHAGPVDVLPLPHRRHDRATLADGERTRIAPQLYYYVGRFGLLGEYTDGRRRTSRALRPARTARRHGRHERLADRRPPGS